jgi:hypothetical protein
MTPDCDCRQGKKYFCPTKLPEKVWGPASLLFNGFQWFFPGGAKRPESEDRHTPPFSAEAINKWSYMLCLYIHSSIPS